MCVPQASFSARKLRDRCRHTSLRGHVDIITKGLAQALQGGSLVNPKGSRKDPVSSQAAYLQRLGVDTAVFERRHVIGGAAVTEEVIPGEP